MKSFYSPAGDSAPKSPSAGAIVVDIGSSRRIVESPITVRVRARVAVYEQAAAAPRVVTLDPLPIDEFIEKLTLCVHDLCRGAGGSVPYTVIREVTENFIHADFAEPIVSILENGSVIRFADQGPGISDKERALLPGFTTARGEMKSYIRGVGSGLPIVRDYLSSSGGSIAIEDNLGSGSVVTIFAGSGSAASQPAPISSRTPVRYDRPRGAVQVPCGQASLQTEPDPLVVVRPRLTARQKQVLALVMESGLAGPSLISKELGVGVSTAYRDLSLLEEAGLIESEAGKRTLSADGLTYLTELTDHL